MVQKIICVFFSFCQIFVDIEKFLMYNMKDF